MGKIIKIGIIGDYNKKTISHSAIEDSLNHSADSLSIEVSAIWLPTESFLTLAGIDKLKDFNAYWVSSGDPKNIDGALTGIRIARETGKPLIAT
jgi:CTP synthase (UTP-ammonia lyase)